MADVPVGAGGKPKRCQHCKRMVPPETLMLSRDPWQNFKEVWVCTDADACSKPSLACRVLS